MCPGAEVKPKTKAAATEVRLRRRVVLSRYGRRYGGGGSPSFSSSSSWMMIRGVTIIIRLCVSPDTDVLEQSADVRHFAEHRHAAFVAAFAEPLDAAQQHRTAVRHAHRRCYRDEGERRQLNRGAFRDGLAGV
jgi:hypothetical protein